MIRSKQNTMFISVIRKIIKCVPDQNQRGKEYWKERLNVRLEGKRHMSQYIKQSVSGSWLEDKQDIQEINITDLGGLIPK